MRLLIFILVSILSKASEGIIKEPKVVKPVKSNEIKFNELDEHTLVTDSEIFPYVVAILKMAKYLSAGALINDKWVLTAGDALFLIRESARLLRVRLGSINYKKGGTLLPVKYFKIHPEFDDSSPVFDIALIRLPQSVRFTPYLKPIRMQSDMKMADATHFIVTSWPFPMMSFSDESEHLKSMELIKRKRILSVTHLHPSEPEDCAEELSGIGITEDVENMMCLDTGVMMDPCMRDVGAPVVLNDVLWGIVSSWRPNNCENDLAGPSFVSLVSAPNISTWIYATLREKDGDRKKIKTKLWKHLEDFEEYHNEEDYLDNVL